MSFKSDLKNRFKFFLMIFGVIIVSFLGYEYFIYKQIQSGDLVKYNGHWYTKEEIAEIIPPQYAESVPEKNTPEEVYVEFRQALLNGEKEKALRYIKEDKKEKYKEAFLDEETFNKMVKTLPEVSEIRKSEYDSYENVANYSYNIEGEELSFGMGFVKNMDGYWEIEFI